MARNTAGNPHAEIRENLPESKTSRLHRSFGTICFVFQPLSE